MQPITVIVVSSEDFESDDPWRVIDSLSGFANLAFAKGCSFADLPREIRWNSEVTNAYGQINRSGPSLYFYNVLAPHDGTERWQIMVDATRAGLRALGNVPQSPVYDKLISVYESNRPAILEGRRTDKPFKLANDFDLLCEFMPSGEAEDEFTEQRARWVRSLPMIRSVPPEVYEQECEKALAGQQL